MAGLLPQKGLAASEGDFLEEAVAGAGFGGRIWVAARPGGAGLRSVTPHGLLGRHGEGHDLRLGPRCREAESVRFLPLDLWSLKIQPTSHTSDPWKDICPHIRPGEQS